MNLLWTILIAIPMCIHLANLAIYDPKDIELKKQYYHEGTCWILSTSATILFLIFLLLLFAGDLKPVRTEVNYATGEIHQFVNSGAILAQFILPITIALIALAIYFYRFLPSRSTPKEKRIKILYIFALIVVYILSCNVNFWALYNLLGISIILKIVCIVLLFVNPKEKKTDAEGIKHTDTDKDDNNNHLNNTESLTQATENSEKY